MKTINHLILSTSPLSQTAKKPRGTASLTHKRSLYRGRRRHSTGKEYDTETGLYYYGARYLDSKTGRWLSGDPAVSDYIPSAPINDEARKRNGNLPGQGGVFNYANLHVYHYAGNNPVKYIDPDGEEDVYFLYVYKTGVSKDQKMQKSERPSINEVVQYLKNNGLTVKVIEAASKSDIETAFTDPDALMIVTSGHGYDKPAIETADGQEFSPSDIKSKGSFLSTVIFENCYQGDYKNDWEASIGTGVNIIGWEGKTSVPETKRFNKSGLFDRQSKNLMDFAKDTVRVKRDIISMPVEKI